jgi:putative two-component system response regulator
MIKVLIVDDNPQNLYMLDTLLNSNHFLVEQASNGVEALKVARQNPPDLVISDILMPTMDGFRLCRIWKNDQELKQIPLIFYTATHTEKMDEVFALSLGAEKYIVKPTDPDELLIIIKEVLEKKAKDNDVTIGTLQKEDEFYKEYNQALVRKLEDKMSQLEESNKELFHAYNATIEGWSKALDLRDNETEGHSLRVTEMTLNLASYFNFTVEELVHARRGALLHDIGKMGVPDKILLKPGPLTDEEWVIMKKHTTFAFDLLSSIDFLRPAIDIPLCHHEKWDGSGYPNGLKGEEIPLAARLFAIVDVWDALRSDRPYRLAWTREKTLDHIKALSGTHFEPDVLKICLESEVLIR